MDIGSLESFVLFSELGSFAKVAEKRFRTNAAISAQMKRLEEEFEAQLFQREGRNVVLTQAGKDLLPFAQYMLDLNRQAKDRLLRSSKPLTLVVGTPSDYANDFLMVILNHVQEIVPDLSTKLIIRPTAELKTAWENSEIDIMLFSSESLISEASVIGKIRGVWVKAQGAQVSSNPWPIVLYDDSCLFNRHAIRGFKEAGIDYRLISTSSDTNVIHHLLHKNRVIAAMGDACLTSGLEQVTSPQLPSLPTVYLMVRVSERFSAIDQDNLAQAMLGILDDRIASYLTPRAGITQRAMT